MSTNSILILGASGQYPSYTITAFLRTYALDPALGNLFNVFVVHGDFETSDGLLSLEATVSKHSIVINAATSRDVAVNEAILRGLAAYRAMTKENAILIHLSGAGNFSDNGKTGEYHSTGEVAGLRLPFDDTDTTAVRKINAHHLPNGASDETIMALTNKGKANTYIVCPVDIYGTSEDHVGLLAATEEGKKYAQTPGVWAGWMIANVKQLGFSPYVGDGKNYFYMVHVDDVVSLILLVFSKAVRERDEGGYGPDDVYSNFYIVAGESYKSSEIAQVFAKVVGNVKAKSVKYEEAGITARYQTGNMLIDAKNAEKLGWEAKGKGFEETVLA